MSKADASAEIGDGRPRRFCDICTQADDHPRHVVVLEDGSTQTRHLDCCADSGCPDGSCVQVREGAEDLRGAALLEHLNGKGAE